MKALLLVDIQNDFMPGGALPVPDGDHILPAVQRLIDMPFGVVVASKDWHPKGHASFAETHLREIGEVVTVGGVEQRLWPTHCVQDTSGSMFAPGWDVTQIDKVVLKGTDLLVDSYSTFFDNARRRDTGLADYLKEHGVTHLYVAGLATDYCVRDSVLDALELGFDTTVVVDACRGIDASPGDVDRALALLQQRGAHLVTSDQINL